MKKALIIMFCLTVIMVASGCGKSESNPKQIPDKLVKTLQSKGLNVVIRDNYPAVIVSGVFNFRSTILTDADKKQLIYISKLIKSVAFDASVRIDGHIDSTSAQETVSEFNQRLSLERAETVRDILVNQDIFAANKISVKGWGDKNPIADNKTDAGRIKNRRIEIVIILE